MRAATFLFYAIATFCLGSIAFEVGGPRLLALLAGSELNSRWQVAWGAGTVGFSLLFLFLAIASIRIQLKRLNGRQLTVEDYQLPPRITGA